MSEVKNVASCEEVRQASTFPWVIPVFSILLFPLSFFIIFSFSMSQQTLSEASPIMCVLAILGYLLFYSPFLAIVVLFACHKYWRGYRVVQIGLLLVCAFCAYFPCWSVKARVNKHFDVKRKVGFFQAVQRLDQEKTLYWAKKIDRSKRTSFARKFLCLGISYELRGDYDASLGYYNMLGERGTSFRGRVHYKQGNFAAAFEDYCQLAELACKQCKWSKKRTFSSPEEREDFLGQLFKRRVLFFNDQNLPELSPFDDYSSFVTFIERQYAQLEEPEKYREPVSFMLRVSEASEPELVDAKIDELRTARDLYNPEILKIFYNDDVNWFVGSRAGRVVNGVVTATSNTKT